jgi:hypothetical protein
MSPCGRHGSAVLRREDAVGGVVDLSPPSSSVAPPGQDCPETLVGRLLRHRHVVHTVEKLAAELVDELLVADVDQAVPA